jgi:quercetin dioxygenase-like cupin family protein
MRCVLRVSALKYWKIHPLHTTTSPTLEGKNMHTKNAIAHLLGVTILTGILTSLACAQEMRSPASKPDSSKWTIDKCVNVFSKDKIEKTDAGYQYWFVDKTLADGKTLKMSVVKPHSATHPPHAHPEEEFFFVLEGKVEFYLNGERKVVGPFSSLYCPSNVEHGIRNVGDKEAKYLVVKKYEKK